MDLINKLTVYACIIYAVTFIFAVGYYTYVYQPGQASTSSQLSQVSQQRDSTAEQGSVITTLTLELIAITILGALEVKFKLLSRLAAWVIKHLNIRYPEWLAKALLPLAVVMAVVGLFVSAFLFLVGFLILVLIAVRYIFRRKSKHTALIVCICFFPLWTLAATSGYGLPVLVAVLCAVPVFTYFMNRKSTLAFNILAVVITISMSLVFGIILGPLAMGILMVMLAVYDYIAVFKTKHMQLLAKGAFSLGLPLAIVVGDSSYVMKRLEGKVKKEKKRSGALLGGGDLIFPAAITATFVFAGMDYYAMCCLVGSFIGIYANMGLLRTGKFKQGIPALPLLTVSVGAMLTLGYLVSVI